MSLSRRRFVQTLGAGAAGAWIGARGREASFGENLEPRRHARADRHAIGEALCERDDVRLERMDLLERVEAVARGPDDAELARGVDQLEGVAVRAHPQRDGVGRDRLRGGRGADFIQGGKGPDVINGAVRRLGRPAQPSRVLRGTLRLRGGVDEEADAGRHGALPVRARNNELSVERDGDGSPTALLGAGAMGCVYRARQVSLGRTVAREWPPAMGAWFASVTAVTPGIDAASLSSRSNASRPDSSS